MFHSSLHLEKFVPIFFYTLSSAIAQSSQSKQWPLGTTVSASSTHADLTGNSFVAGQFTADKAIDNDADSTWADHTHEGDTAEPYPDIFNLNVGSVVNLDGVVLLSNNNGWPLNYTVETSLNGASWTLAATVKLSDVVLRIIRFDNGPLHLKQLRITVTAALNGYTRISELAPIYAAAANSTIAYSSSQPSSTSGTKSNIAEIIAGVLGGVAGILLAALGYFLWLLRKRRNSAIDTAGIQGAEDEIPIGGTQTSSVNYSSEYTNVTSELGIRSPQEVNGYSVNELA